MMKLERGDRVLKNIEEHQQKNWRHYRNIATSKNSKHKNIAIYSTQDMHGMSMLSETSHNYNQFHLNGVQKPRSFLPDIKNRDSMLSNAKSHVHTEMSHRLLQDPSSSIMQQESSLKKLRKMSQDMIMSPVHHQSASVIIK